MSKTNKKIVNYLLPLIIILFIIFIFTYSIYRSKASSLGLNILIKLQGDYSKTKNLTINSEVQVFSFSKKTVLHQYPLSQKENNLFQLNISLPGFSSEEPVSIFIKPEKYFGRFFPNLKITNTENSYTLTEKIFYSGDINPTDGRISASDISLIFSKLGSRVDYQKEKTDLNNDNLVDTQDYMMALISLKDSIIDEEIIIPTPTPTPIITITPTQTITSAPTGNCSAVDNGLPNSTMHHPYGSTHLPSTTKQICSYRPGYYYSLPYRNPNCRATQLGINKAYERMRTYYPTYFPQTKLLDDWETVQQYAIKYNFNPLFVIALWIEESAAGGATNAQQLGCLYRLNKDDTFTFLSPNSTICEQMECLFGRRSVIPENYALWACQYQFGYRKWENSRCVEATSFTKGIEFWYNYIKNNSGTNLPLDCEIKYYVGSDSRCHQ